ncbi:MAG: hypothetical protein M1814_005698 [Vezdaea aestivalis]|nr:MAG: hypothetical protein M1814_005698 [Vezdaea aestivalis]
MATHSAFFYGTLMAPEVLNRVIHGPDPTQKPPPRAPAQTAFLPGHIRHRVQYADYPAIIPDQTPGASVRGTYVRELTDADMWRLDVFEGSDYKRIKVRVVVGESEGKGEEMECWTYLWKAQEDDLEKGEWDFEDFRKEKLRYWAGSSEEYKAVDQADSEHDFSGGRLAGGAISKELAGSW